MRRRLERRGQKGVTFLELIVTIAIIGILAAIAVPYYGDYISRQRLIGASEAVYAQLQAAKRNAVSNNKTIYFVTAGSGGTNWCATFSEVSSAGASCTSGFVVDADNLSPVIKSTDYPNVTMTGPSYIGFVMPGSTMTNNSNVSLSIGSVSLGDLGVRISPSMNISICTSGPLTQYDVCD